MKSSRIVLLGLIPVFALLVAVPKLARADDSTSTPDAATTTTDTAITTPDATSTDATSTVDTTPPPQDQITLTIRDASTTAFSGTVILPDASSTDILVTPTNSTTSIAVSPRSLLGVLESLEASSSAFNITDLAYYPSFSPPSFLINCIAVPATAAVPDCYDWTYAVDGSYPQIGADQEILNNGDVVYLFFGFQNQVVLSTNSVPAGQQFTATAEQYNLSSGSYSPLPGVVIGVGNYDQNPPYDFVELATSTADTNGQAVFTLNATGTLAVGIQPDYFPTASITITDATSTPPSGGGSTGGGSSPNTCLPTFNVSCALAFISTQQNPDGSFSSPDITDWVAIAFGAADPGAAKTKLHDYLVNEPLTSISSAQGQPPAVSDYERHAMALEALGINPYNGASADFITPIVKSFDGTQIGNSALDNDDIFSIFPLTFAGYASWFSDPSADPYSSSDRIIQQEVKFILSRQKPDGSWDESVDMTAAAIQALGPFTAPFPGNTEANAAQLAIGNSIGYLVTNQQDSGGWGTDGVTNVDSTSWVQTMINSIPPDHSFLPPFKSAKNLLPTDALAAAQQPDGGIISTGNRVWSTSYAIVAASGKSWLTELSSFPKPSGSTTAGGGANQNTTTSTTIPSLISATSTPSSTTTPAIVSPTSTAPTIVIIAPPKNIALTTTPPVAPKPKPKFHKPIIKKPAVVIVPQVLGAQTQQVIPPQPPSAQTPPAPPASPGFFGSLWHAIASFFHHIF